MSLAEVAYNNNYIKPEITLNDEIKILEGRHPVVELTQKEELFIPNDTHINCSDNLISLITGPNMAGKSTFMRQVALIVIMAQIGCFVPATKAELGIVDRIFTRIGASDNLAMGQSTFMVEMMEVANILKHATDKSLLILDEVGRGTSTFDGLSIAWSVVEYIQKNLKSKTLFATHYHELTALKELKDNPDDFKKPVDDMYNIVKEEFDQIDPKIKKGLIISKSYNSRAVEVNYENTWSGNELGVPIFSIEDMYAGSQLMQTGLSQMGVIPTVAYDGNILISPGLGTTDDDGQIIESNFRYAVKAQVKLMEIIAKYSGYIE